MVLGVDEMLKKKMAPGSWCGGPGVVSLEKVTTGEEWVWRCVYVGVNSVWHVLNSQCL